MTVDGGDGDKCIWVTRPIPEGGIISSSEEEEIAVKQDDGAVVPMSTDLILCHICERSIPALAFLLHNDTCRVIYRAEMDIGIFFKLIITLQVSSMMVYRIPESWLMKELFYCGKRWRNLRSGKLDKIAMCVSI
jgi:hypothetical protein